MPFARFLLLLAATALSPFAVVNAQDRDEPAEGRESREQGDGDRPERERGPRDGDRPEHERGPRDGDRPERERGPRDGDRPEHERGPRDGDRPERERGPRDGDRPPMREGEQRDGDRRPGPIGPILDLLDRNHNGVLESEEIDQAIVVLRRMDRNGDGRLTGEEFGQRREEGRPPMREGDRPRGDRPPEGRRPSEGGREGQRPTAAQMKERFLAADKDGDKKLSKEEAPDRLKQGFDRVDTDGSGFIEEAELDAMIRRFEQAARGAREGQPRGPREGDRGAGRERGEDRPAVE